MSRSPALVLVGTPIGNLGDLGPRALEEFEAADVLAAEDTRRLRTLLSHGGIPARGRLRAVHAHNEAEMAERLADDVAAGQRVVFVSDAGMPGISDPGARLVAACARRGLPVEVVPGPSAVVAAVALSGFAEDRFVFEGFLPRKGRERSRRLAAIGAEERCVVLFEAANRLAVTLSDLAGTAGPGRGVVLARELTKLHEEVWRGTLGECRQGSPVESRGEVVVVLGPGAAPPPVRDEAIEDVVRADLDRGASVRDAAGAAARSLGVSRRRAYNLAVRVRASRDPR